MKWRWMFPVIWVLLILYSILLSPGYDPDTIEQVMNMMTGNINEVEPLVFMLFNLMGVMPMIFASILLFERNRVPSWPFVLGSFFAGAFSLLPYMGVRDPDPEERSGCTLIQKVLDSRYYAIALKVFAMGLIAYGIGAGDPGEFIDQFSSSMFIHVMTLDFLALNLLIPFVIKDDMKRRGWDRKGSFWVFALVPVLGPLAYLVSRPGLCGEKEDKIN